MKRNNVLWACCVTLLVASCAPKGGVLRSPSQSAGNVGNNNSTDSTEVTDGRSDADETAAPLLPSANIAMVLPFQLDKIGGAGVTEEDVKRSSLALDFYQGFQLGLNETIEDGELVSLHVLDSKDSPADAAAIAQSEDANAASVVIGPIYPQEIKAFGQSLRNKNVIQVNPLAATMPTEFNLPNLLSITPPISVHMRAIAAQVIERYRTDDAVIVYNVSNNDHQQFINGFVAEIKQRNPEINVLMVSSPAQLAESLNAFATNHVITGTTDRNQIKSLMAKLDELYIQENYTFRLYGHPLWERFDFSAYPHFAAYDPLITAESHFDSMSGVARGFDRSYQESFGVNPSDYAYKGYDAGRYFGFLISKYGSDFSSHIKDEVFRGLYSDYKFNYNDRWGYVNFGVTVKNYFSGKFQSKERL